ncbi:MAG: glycosyltransferase [Spirochaetes bacterium]|nr:glycosyltransferase [Spirochaetota bacterium]
MPPRVSVVMPVKNADPWLEETLASILRQTLHDFELIAVNDHSHDATETILAAAARRDQRVRVLQNRGRGLVTALNTGIAAAQGEFIARMDGDDFMPERRLELQAHFLEKNPTATLVAGKVEHWGNPELTAGYSRYVDFINSLHTPEDFRLRQFIESPLAHPSVTLRRSALQDAPYRDGDFPEDYDLWLRLLAAGARFHALPETVLRWRDHPQRTSRVDPRYDTEKFYRHKAGFIAAWLKKAGHSAVKIWAGGRRSRRRIDALRAEGIGITAYVDIHPRRIGQTIDGVPVIAPEGLLQTRAEFILVYVGSTGARAAIGDWLRRHDFTEGENFLFAA